MRGCKLEEQIYKKNETMSIEKLDLKNIGRTEQGVETMNREPRLKCQFWICPCKKRQNILYFNLLSPCGDRL